MANRFSGQQDYSQTFQSLVTNNQRYLEAAAQRVDAQREAEWAARDALIFTKWQEGKISGSELMAHINMRMRQSGYDRAAQDRWREAAIKYGGAIADERAEAAYAENNNINALIAHYTKRLAAAASGTPERTELAQRVKALREKRDSDRVATQARKINRQIAKGNMGNKDLLKFYKDQLKTGVKGELRQNILDQIASLRGKIRDENFQVAMTEIDTLLDSGSITPQEAARRKAKVLGQFDIEKRDPVGFAEWNQQLQQLRATPDPAEIEQLQFDLLQDRITPEQYYAQINKWADRIAPFDLQGSWALRQEAENFLESEATPLEQDSELGQANSPTGGSRGYTGTVDVVKRLRGNAIKYISQFDGSKYSGTNCGMASGAMLAHMMGYEGLTGADLRALSGDVSGGTNVFQVQQALAQAGVPAGDLEARSNWTFSEFKKKVMSGAPAVLAGWTGDLPPQLNSTSGAMGHAVSVAGYDPQRDAFLILDPSGDKVWWPASVVQDFAWGGEGHQGGFNGYALFAPRNTVDPKTLDRVGGKVKHIRVDAPPTNPNAAPIRSRTDPGPADRAKAANDAMRLSQVNKERMRDAGISPGKDLDTKQEAAEFIDNRAAEIANVRSYIDEWTRLAEGGAYDEEAGGIEMISTGEIVRPQDIAQMQKELLYLYDGQRILYRAVGDKEGVAASRAAMNEVMEDAAVVNTIEANFASNRVVASLADTIDDINEATSPSERRQLMTEIYDTVGVLAGIDEAQAEQEATPTRKDFGTTEDPQTPTDEMAQRVDEVTMPGTDAVQSQWATLADVLGSSDDYESVEDYAAAIDEAMAEFMVFEEGSPQMEAIQTAVVLAVEQKGLATGEMVNVSFGGELVTLPATQGLNGEPIPDFSDPTAAPYGEKARELQYNVYNLPPTYINGADGAEQVFAIPTLATYPGIEFLSVTELAAGTSGKELIERLGIDLPSEGFLSNDDIAALSPEQIAMLLEAGLVQNMPFQAQRVEIDGQTFWRDVGISEDGTPVYSWHEDTLPNLNPKVNAEGDDIFDTPFRGVDSESSGVAWPEVTADPEDMDDSDAGSPAILVGMTPEEKSQTLVELRDNGIIRDQLIRDPENPTTFIAPTPGAPGSYESQKPFSVLDSIAQNAALRAKRDEKLISTMSEEEAADMAFWEEADRAQRAQMMGIDPKTSDWRSSGPGTEKPPSSEVLESLGIKPPTENEPEQQTFFDPMAAVMDKVMGVAKANAAEQAAKKAAAEAEKAEAARAAMASPLPKVTTPAPSPKPNLPDGTTTKQTTRPSPAPSPTPTRPQTSPKSNYDPLSSIKAPKPTAPPASTTTTTSPKRPRTGTPRSEIL